MRCWNSRKETMSLDKYDDSKEGGYSVAEKLAMVAQEQMDPAELGLPDAKAAKNIITGENEKPEVMKLGDFVTFEASVVPPRLRAHWAYQDLEVKPGNQKDWEANWCEEHKDEYAIQGLLHSGAMAARVGQLFRDPILGFCELMRKNAQILEDKYNELKKTDPNPIVTRDETAKAQSNVRPTVLPDPQRSA